MTSTNKSDEMRKALDELEEGVHYFMGMHAQLLDGYREGTTLHSEHDKAREKISKLADNARKVLGKR